MFEQLLISHCSPTLAGLKVGNLFVYRHMGSIDISSLLLLWNQRLNQGGIFITSLKNCRYSSLIYVYHKDRLISLLSQNEIRSFLVNYGYTNSSLSVILDSLRDNISKSSVFPHEIGVFLDYPLNDVKGFIENNGQNYKCVGCWKVYCDQQYAMDCFHRFKRCKHIFTHLHSQGYSAQELLNYNKGELLV